MLTFSKARLSLPIVHGPSFSMARGFAWVQFDRGGVNANGCCWSDLRPENMIMMVISKTFEGTTDQGQCSSGCAPSLPLPLSPHSPSAHLHIITTIIIISSRHHHHHRHHHYHRHRCYQYHYHRYHLVVVNKHINTHHHYQQTFACTQLRSFTALSS